MNGEWLRVEAGGGRAFEYWHIRAAVTIGAQVEAQQTVLGHILRGSGHVHLTELANGRPTNPLAPGHIGPYADHTTPVVTSVSFRRGETGADQLPNLVRGRVLLVARAQDRPTLNAPEGWSGLPVTPALIMWQIRSWTGKVVLGRRVAADFRGSLPNRSFWNVYARPSSPSLGTPYAGPTRTWPCSAVITRGLSLARTCSGSSRSTRTACATAPTTSSSLQQTCAGTAAR